MLEQSLIAQINKSNNDATGSKLGDIYQYTIALLKCFEVQEQEVLLIETLGDVTILSQDNNRIQMEVKHHKGEDNLGERDIDIWKTLKNWVKEFDKFKGFEKLVLFTTSVIKEDSVFKGWNDKQPLDKFNILKEIGKEEKKKEQGFRELYKIIFEEFSNELRELISNIEIQSAQENIYKINKEFDDVLRIVPSENRETCIAALLGQIIVKIKDTSGKWYVTYKEFDNILQVTLPNYLLKIKQPLEVEGVEDIELEDQLIQEHRDKRFVREITKIKYERMINKAVVDYWKTNRVITSYYRENWRFKKDLRNYQEELTQVLAYDKEIRMLECEGKDRSEQLKEAKKFYSSSMKMEPKAFGNMVDNKGFFQRGTIHNIVDKGDLVWEMEEN